MKIEVPELLIAKYYIEDFADMYYSDIFTLLQGLAYHNAIQSNPFSEEALIISHNLRVVEEIIKDKLVD